MRDLGRNRAKYMATALALLLVLSLARIGYAEEVPPGMRDCKNCHTLNKEGTTVILRLPLNDLCTDCHTHLTHSGEHPVDVRSSYPVRFLPLGRGGAVTCVTCHEPHGLTGRLKLLRANPSVLCNYCHQK